jgi:hypothetical protein
MTAPQPDLDPLATVRAFLDSFCARTFEDALPLLTADCRAIGSAPQERADGIEAIRAGLELERDSLNVPVSYDITASHARDHGATAWVETDLMMTAHTEPAPFYLPPLRWTWFLRREGPAWLIEHWHASVGWGADDEYESVPTSEIHHQRRALNDLVELRMVELGLSTGSGADAPGR